MILTFANYSTRFLAIPDSTNVANLLFKSVSVLAAFPFVHKMAPAVLTYEALVKIIALYTRRLNGILNPDYDLGKLLFYSFSTVENRRSNDDKETLESSKDKNDIAHESDDEDEDLVVFSISGKEAWNNLPYIIKYDHEKSYQIYITAYDLHNLVSFLLCIFDLKPELSLASQKYAEYFGEKQYTHFEKSALNILRAIDPDLPERENYSSKTEWEDKLKGVKIEYSQFSKAYQNSFPYLFHPLSALFERFLFSNEVNGKLVPKEPTGFNEKPEEGIENKPSLNSSVGTSKKSLKSGDIFEREGTTKLINPATMAQLGTIFGHEIYGKFKKLYIGSGAGFSLRSFETKVFKWRAPTLLLISGREIEVPGVNSRERQFNDFIPPLSSLRGEYLSSDHTKRHPRSFMYCAYITDPWKAHAKKNFGNDESMIIQLKPVQDKFSSVPIVSSGPYSTRNPQHEQFVYFSRAKPGGIGFGSAPPQPLSKSASKVVLGSSASNFSLGNVSLTLDDALEFGVFRHVGLGGSYRPTTGAREAKEWEDRFEISEIEVWGSGKDEDLEEQRKQWEWEEREAQYRQRVNVKNIGEERAFLELAGLVGNHGNGGSMG